jgi:regulator of protease activity HflC (stomatin/prohibitin superfamily)
MLEKLIDLLLQLGSVASPLVVVHAWQGAAVLRFGRYHRTLEPGFHWKIPFLEDALEAETCVTTMRLPPQSLTTKDKVEVVVSCIIKYQIKDLRPYVCDIYDQKDVMGDVTMGAIGRTVRQHTYEELTGGTPEADVVVEVRKAVNKYGFRIEQITFIDLCRAKSLRLVAAAAKDLDN